MKKSIMFVCLTVLLIGSSSLLFAATRQDYEVFKASISFTSVGATYDFDAAISGGASSLSWEDVEVGTTAWKAAEEYISITANSTRTGWGVQIYTDNKNNSTTSSFTGNENSINPAGLIRQNTPAYPNNANSGMLPMCWRITDGATTTLNIQETPEHHLYDPVVNPNPKTASNPDGIEYWPFLWVKDKSTKAIAGSSVTDFVDGEPYVTVWDSAGIHHAEGPYDYFYPSSGDVRIYIGANFQNVKTVPNSYATDSLTVELFWP